MLKNGHELILETRNITILFFLLLWGIFCKTQTAWVRTSFIAIEQSNHPIHYDLTFYELLELLV